MEQRDPRRAPGFGLDGGRRCCLAEPLRGGQGRPVRFYERSKGKKAKLSGIELLFRRHPSGGQLAILSSMWEDGIFFGVRSVSAEVIFGSAAGVWRTRTVQRRTEAARLKPEAADLIGGIPRKTSSADSSTDGPLENLELGVRLPREEMELGRQAEELAPPSKFLIKQSDLNTHGCSDGCRGCISLIARRGREPHSDRCQKRLQQCEERRSQAERKRVLGENSSTRSNRRRCDVAKNRRRLRMNGSPLVDGEAARGSGDPPREITANTVPKRDCWTQGRTPRKMSQTHGPSSPTRARSNSHIGDLTDLRRRRCVCAGWRCTRRQRSQGGSQGRIGHWQAASEHEVDRLQEGRGGQVASGGP